jgi:hypothetical protein
VNDINFFNLNSKVIISTTHSLITKINIIITVIAFPIINNAFFALVKATFILLPSFKNPIPPDSDDLTQLNKIISFSYP